MIDRMIYFQRSSEARNVPALIKHYANQYGFDPLFISAMAAVESSGNPWATRYEEDWPYLYKARDFSKKNNTTYDTEVIHQKTSWGLLQMMGTVAREMNYDGPLPMLCQPEINLNLCLKKLQDLTAKYISLDKVIASYNAGSVILTTDGRFMNQLYVDKVLSIYGDLKKSAEKP